MRVVTLAAATLLFSAAGAKKDDGGSSQYDFIVVGAGTAGLAVANRISEMKDFKVAIIEAGDSVLNNFNVSTVSGYGLAFGTEIDWAYQTKNQTYAGGSAQIVRAGKAVGGTSTINGMDVIYSGAKRTNRCLGTIWKPRLELGVLLPYYKKSERFQVPNSDQVSRGADYYIKYHGDEGPVKVGWPKRLTPSDVLPVLDKTFHKLNISYNRDVNGGSMVGLTSHPNTVDSDANVRQDSARSYYWPYEDRPNLKLITNTRVNRIIWSNKPNETVAIGVEVTGIDRVYTIYAAKEVILSAGSLRSPGLLELSGVGNPDLLKSLNIPVMVNLSSVGENLQDQTNNALAYAGADVWFGSPTFSVLPSAKQIFGKEVSTIASMVSDRLEEYAKNVSELSHGAVKADNVLEALKFQHELIYKSQVPFAEIVMLPISNSFSSEYWTLLPFSRGSIHITSADASVPAEIDPRYFMFDSDLSAQVAVAKFIRKAFGTTPLNTIVGLEFAPGLKTIPSNATDATWQGWIERQYRSNFHPVGTASMLPREKGGS
ncbi:hypothetical protein N7470_006682 [Penicillium chermesinum]|nr:hypothetical protein N7470_006682 [Penicillium chermesinum]